MLLSYGRFQGVVPLQGIGTVTVITSTPEALLKSALPYEQALKAP